MRKDAAQTANSHLCKRDFHQRHFDIYTGHCSWLCQERVRSFSRLGTKSCHFPDTCWVSFCNYVPKTQTISITIRLSDEAGRRNARFSA